MSYRYGIDGERIELDEDTQALRLHPSTCVRGWIEVDGETATVAPCPTCKPDTAARLRARKDH